MNRSARRRTWFGLLASCIALATLPLGAAGLLQAPRAYAVGSTYYIGCQTASDSQSGLSPQAAWRTLARASAAALTPGDSLLLERGCVWEGPLQVAWQGTAAQPVLVGAYGSGAPPRIQNADGNVVISGSYTIVENLQVTASAPMLDPGCNNQPVGSRAGIKLTAGATYNVVRGVSASGLSAAVHVLPGAHHNALRGNTLANNNMMVRLDRQDPNNDSGAFGVLLEGDDNEVAYNQISGGVACSYDYGHDGSAVEVFGGQRNVVHHNRSVDNLTFTELGNARSADNTFAYNVVTSSLPESSLVITRGSGDTFGPVARTRVYNNTVYLSAVSSRGAAIGCYGGCTADTLNVENNLVWSNGPALYYTGAIAESHNLYWSATGRPLLYSPMGSTSRVADPKLADPAASDLHLTAASPAVDAGATQPSTAGVVDYEGKPIPLGKTVDIGAYEYDASGPTDLGATATASPTPPRAAASATPLPSATLTPSPTSTLARTATPTGAALAGPSPTVTSVPGSGSAVGCSPRPPIEVAAVPGQDGRLRVTVGATTAAGAAANALRAVRFTNATNAVIEIDGQPTPAPGTTISLPAGTSRWSFAARSATAKPLTINLVAVDDCGDWPTFVGSGPTALPPASAGTAPSPGPAAAAIAAPTRTPPPASIRR